MTPSPTTRNNNSNKDVDGADNNLPSFTTEIANQKRKRSKALVELSSAPKPTPKFSVTYSRLCDGGTQEMSTAVACVREVFPDAIIQTTRRKPQEDAGVANPSVVISVADSALEGGSVDGGSTCVPGRRRSSSSTLSSSNGDWDVLWSVKQTNLYEKYPKKRRRSMKDIRKSLVEFKSLLDTQDIPLESSEGDEIQGSNNADNNSKVDNSGETKKGTPPIILSHSSETSSTATNAPP